MSNAQPSSMPLHIPLLVVVHRNPDKVQATIGEVLDVVSPLGEPGDIEPADWMLYQEEPLDKSSASWMALCRRFLQYAQRLGRLRGHKTWHVFLDCPAALALGLGASLGTRYRLVVYHRQPYYTPVMDVTDPVHFKRRLTSPPQYIAVQHPPHWTPDVFVSLQMSSYSPEPYLRELAARQGAALVVIGNLYDNALPLEADWLQAAHEVADALTTVYNQPGVHQVHLAFSCPVPLAFGIGMALGIQPAVRVYNWYADPDNTYEPVLDLNRLRDLGAQAADLPALDLNVPSSERLAPLRRALAAHFDLDELETLCFDLGVDFDALSGQGKENKARDLLSHLDRRARIPDLLTLGSRLRPDLNWHKLTPPDKQ